MGDEALRHIVDKLALAAGGRDERLSVTVDCGGYEEYIGNDVINAAVEELETIPAPLVWSSERPKIAGDYLVRDAVNHELRWLVQLTPYMLGFNPASWYEGKEFAGPFIIQEPPK